MWHEQLVVVGAATDTHCGEVGEVVAAAPCDRDQMMDLEAVGAQTPGNAAVAVALSHRTLFLRRGGPTSAALYDRCTELVSNDRREPRLCTQGFDHGIGQRDAGEQLDGSFGWDVNDEVGPVRIMQVCVGIGLGVVVASQPAQLDERVRAALGAGRPTAHLWRAACGR